MKQISRLVIGGLMLAVIITGCNLPAQTQVPVGTMLPNDLTQLSTPTLSTTATGTPVMPVIPITGENVVQLQCQFCVNDQTHAVLVFPEFAIFDVETTTPVTCLTAQIVNGKRVVVCHGTQLTTFNLKICSDLTNCLLYPIALQACPLGAMTGTPLATLTTSTPLTPIFLTPINTLRPPTQTPVPSTAIPTQGTTPTGAPPPTSTSEPTSAPTSEPTTEPTSEPTPVPTQEPTSSGSPPNPTKTAGP